MAELSVDQRNALQIITDEFAAYGIEGLADVQNNTDRRILW